MGRVTAASLFAAICFVGVAHGMDCSFGRDGILGTALHSCPANPVTVLALGGSSTASYCCPRPNGKFLVCCEASEFYGIIFGVIFIFALLIGCCCACCACCPCYHFCHKNSTGVAVIGPSGYPGTSGRNNFNGTDQPGIAMHQQYPSHTGYVRA